MSSKNGFGPRSMPDGRSGGGYGTYTGQGIGSDSKAEEVWPYTKRTRLEIVAAKSNDDEGSSKKAIKKKLGKRFINDKPQALNYKSGSFVNGQTRGLTGIMSGVDPMDILESIIKRVRPRENAKPLGQSAPFSTMSSDATTRTRPGMTLGSKAGWFGPPPPKDSDPSSEMHAYDLEDVADNQEKRALFNSDYETKRIKRKNVALESKVAVLRSYVLFRELSENNATKKK